MSTPISTAMSTKRKNLSSFWPHSVDGPLLNVQFRTYGRHFVDIGVDIGRKKTFRRTSRAVKAGGAEGDTCGPRALRARRTGEDTLDEAAPPGGGLYAPLSHGHGRAGLVRGLHPRESVLLGR